MLWGALNGPRVSWEGVLDALGGSRWGLWAPFGSPWGDLRFPKRAWGVSLRWFGGSWALLLAYVGGPENIEKTLFFVVFLRFGAPSSALWGLGEALWEV